MNYNQSVDISTMPSANIERSVFDLSFPLYTTFNTGDLVPIFCEDVLPGDTFKISTNFVARLQTLYTPIFSNLYLDVNFFFVPNRLIWKHWREFCGENTSSYWTQPVEYVEPTVNVEDAVGEGAYTALKQFDSKSLADYLGYPTKKTIRSGVMSCLPMRAAALCYNEWYRDENNQEPLVISLDDTSPSVDNSLDLTTHQNLLNYYQTGFTGLLKANKYHDLFTSALPEPQKGPDVLIPFNGVTPVKAGGITWTDEVLKDYNPMNPAAGRGKIYGLNMLAVTGTSGDNMGTGVTSARTGTMGVNSGDVATINQTSNTVTNYLTPSNLLVDFSDGVQATINDLRLAIATQRYYEQLATSGSRYTEILSGLFGIESPDARLQRPELIGSMHSVLNVEQVVQTSESSANSPLGDTGAFSVSADSQETVEKSFLEHGWVLGFATVRYTHDYQNNLPRKFQRHTKFDYYWPVFKNLGNVGIKKSEVWYSGTSSDDDIFGYQEAWYSYRHRNSANVTGEMRSNYTTSQDFWHLADDYASQPSLSGSWLEEDHNTVNRVLTVTSTDVDQILANFYFDVKATRPMPAYSIPGSLTL